LFLRGTTQATIKPVSKNNHCLEDGVRTGTNRSSVIQPASSTRHVLLCVRMGCIHHDNSGTDPLFTCIWRTGTHRHPITQGAIDFELRVSGTEVARRESSTDRGRGQLIYSQVPLKAGTILSKVKRGSFERHIIKFLLPLDYLLDSFGLHSRLSLSGRLGTYLNHRSNSPTPRFLLFPPSHPHCRSPRAGLTVGPHAPLTATDDTTHTCERNVQISACQDGLRQFSLSRLVSHCARTCPLPASMASTDEKHRHAIHDLLDDSAQLGAYREQ